RVSRAGSQPRRRRLPLRGEAGARRRSRTPPRLPAGCRSDPSPAPPALRATPRASGGEALRTTGVPEAGRRLLRRMSGPTLGSPGLVPPGRNGKRRRPLEGPTLLGGDAGAVEPRKGRLERVDVDDVEADTGREQRAEL